MTQAITLQISYENSSSAEIREIDPAELMKTLQGNGYQYIDLVGGPIGEITNKISLYVENDAEFLAEGYFSLEDNLQAHKASFEHFCYLGDGLLEIRAKVNGDEVSAVFNYCPGLDVSNLISYKLKITIEQYIDMWKGIVLGLLTGLKQKIKSK